MPFTGKHLIFTSWYPNIAPGDAVFSTSVTVGPNGDTIAPADWHPLQPGPVDTSDAPTVTVSGNSIKVVYPAADAGGTLAHAPFNGTTIQTPVTDPIFGDVTMTSNIVGLDSSRLTTGEHAIDVNLEGLTLPSNARATIVFTMAPALLTTDRLGDPAKWADQAHITISTQKDFPGDFKPLLVAAEHVWESAANIHFVTVSDSTAAGHVPDIRVGVADLGLAHTGTLGVTTKPSITHVNGGTVDTMNPGVTADVESPAETPISAVGSGDFQYNLGEAHNPFVLGVIIHEIGHALGLADNLADPESVMNWGATQVLAPDQNDRAALQFLYGPPP